MPDQHHNTQVEAVADAGPFQENLLNWLRTQDLVLRCWRDEILCLPETDPSFIQTLDAHRDWLRGELRRLEGLD